MSKVVMCPHCNSEIVNIDHFNGDTNTAWYNCCSCHKGFNADIPKKETEVKCPKCGKSDCVPRKNVSGGEYATCQSCLWQWSLKNQTVDVPIDISDETFNALAKMAHSQDITFNELVNNILRDDMNELDRIIKADSYYEEFQKDNKAWPTTFEVWLSREKGIEFTDKEYARWLKVHNERVSKEESETLLPCPFCGNKNPRLSKNTLSVSCDSCGASMETCHPNKQKDETDKECNARYVGYLIKDWNSRYMKMDKEEKSFNVFRSSLLEEFQMLGKNLNFYPEWLERKLYDIEVRK